MGIQENAEGFRRVQDGPVGSRRALRVREVPEGSGRVWESSVGSLRIQEKPGGSGSNWEGPGATGRVRKGPEGFRRVQDGPGGSRRALRVMRVRECPEWSWRVSESLETSVMVQEQPGGSVRV